MQEYLHNLALRLARIQPLVVLAGLAALLAAGSFALNPKLAGDRYLIPTILLCCWCLLVYTLINMFCATPPSLARTQGFFRRLAVRFQRLLRNLLALCFLGLTGALLVLSYKLAVTGVG
ncbi:MAG: hypothetical protein R3F41_08990 [Gammaproteobacteria bacterium]|nr:hypothetical protein [Pseudomonadales bacterium]MCP5347735.1 hypothetical protein [Pseudomonadales bacterium]